MRVIASILFLAAATAFAANPALTIYNQDFAVVRDTVPLDLKSGVNEVRFSDATAHVEPDSVILRDPTENHSLQVLEQNYRNDPVSQDLLLSLFEGQTIQFETTRMKDNTQVRELISGKIIRSGYVPHYDAMSSISDLRWLMHRVLASPSSKWTANCVSICRVSPSFQAWEMTQSSNRLCTG